MSVVTIVPSHTGLAEIGALLRRLQRNYVATLGTVEVIVVVVMALTTHGSFLRTSSLRTSFVDMAVNLGPAVGLTMVILTGGIDVSVASVVAVDASLVGLAFEHGVPFVLVLLLGLLGGALAGAMNALLIVGGKIPPIVATLATSSIWLAVSFWVLGGNWITAIPSSLSTITSISGLGPLPWSLMFVLAVTASAAYFMRQRPLGRVIYAVGNNQEAAKTSGLPVGRAKVMVYVTIGLLTGMATLLLVGQSPVVSPETGSNIFLPILAAVVVGGTSITGGRGSILGSLLGVVLVELVNDAVILYHVNPFWDDVVLGVIIVVAVVIGLGSRYTAAIGEGKL
ncbi:MAG: ABC transporter permease [Actinomycetota bacterium]|nr:ABC transporter permease [Actinomycetota bacterium]